MKKYKIEKWHFNIAIIFTVIIAFLNLFNIEYWSRSGWHEPSLFKGLFWLLIAALIYLFAKYKTEEPEVFRCQNCDDVFWEKDLNDSLCPSCGGEVENIKS